MKRTLQIVSLSHINTSASQRISMDLSTDQWASFKAFMVYTLGAQGVVNLATCNRVEMYFESQNDLREKVIAKWIEIANPKVSIDPSIFKTFFGIRPSIHYLLELSTGLHSAVFGDDQILFQVKKAFAEASQQKQISTLLERAFQMIMRLHKKICKETPFKEQSISLAYAALKTARNQFGKDKLKLQKMLIIGAGDMAAQVVKYLPKFKFESICLSNRSEENAYKVIGANPIEFIPYNQLDVSQYDIIISCTPVGYLLLNDVESISMYIDLSLQSTMDLKSDYPTVRLEDLQEILNLQNKKRASSIAIVKRFLSEHSNEYIDWAENWFKNNKESSSLSVID